MKKFAGRLPNGEITKSARVYAREWRKLGNAAAAELGGKLYAYGSGVSISIGRSDYSVRLNVQTAEKLKLLQDIRKAISAASSHTVAAKAIAALLGFDEDPAALRVGSRHEETPKPDGSSYCGICGVLDVNNPGNPIFHPEQQEGWEG